MADTRRKAPKVADFAPAIFIVVGLAMITLAALDYLSAGVASTFAVLGTALIVLGGLLRLIEGVVKVGPQGFEATLRQEAEATKHAVHEILSEREAEIADATVDTYIDRVARGMRLAGAASRQEAPDGPQRNAQGDRTLFPADRETLRRELERRGIEISRRPSIETDDD
jgi:hypothetical protein